MPKEKTTKEKLLDEFEKLTPYPEDCGDNYDEQKEWLEKNKHLYNNEVYNEPMYDLSEDKIKDFLSKAIDQTREETIKDIEESLPEFKGILIGSNGYFFDNRMSHIDEPKEDIAFNNCLVAVKDILNKLKK